MTRSGAMMKQSGITLTGMLFGSIVLILLLLLGFKLVPVYSEYYAIQKNFKALADDPSLKSASRKQVATAFALRSTVDDIRSIRPDDIQVTKTGNGIVLRAEYEKKVHLFHNVSACFEFSPSSE
jgi:uncharacterized protein DUF4845